MFPDLMPRGRRGALIVIGTVWFVNAVNFLDGLDWMTVAQVVPMTLGVAVLAGARRRARHHRPAGARPARRHARLRRLQQAPGADLSRRRRQPADRALPRLHADLSWRRPISPRLCCLPLYTLADPTLTLFRRMLQPESRSSSAHRTHFYQRAVTNGLERAASDGADLPALRCCSRSLAVATVLANSPSVDLVCARARRCWPQRRCFTLWPRAREMTRRVLDHRRFGLHRQAPDRRARQRGLAGQGRRRAIPPSIPATAASSASPCPTSRSRPIGRRCSTA